MQYWVGYGIPTVILLIALVYGVYRAGWFSPREQRQLDANTRMAQQRDDPGRSNASGPANAGGDTGYAGGTRRMFAAAAVIAAVVAIATLVWPLVTQNQVGTPKGGANPSTASDTTTSRGAPAQQGAESTVGKSNPAGQDTNNARAKDIKQSSRALQLTDQQRQQIKDVIARQSDAPRLQTAPFELMIGSAVPQQVELKDIPPEITQVMNGYWGDEYVLVQDKMVIVDQHSRRVAAIVPAT
jgi:Spy/CpxP family protein refolding chaperone